MLVFHAPSHELHAPRLYVADGTVRPCPEVPERAARLLNAVRGLPDLNLHTGEGVDPFPTIEAIHTPDYLEYLRTIHAEFFGEFGGTGAVDVFPDTFPRPDRRFGHNRPKKTAAQSGYYCFDMAAPIAAGTWHAALDSARSAIAAAEAVHAGAPAAYALCRPPGHHAGADYCGGFCYLNNAACAAQQLRGLGHERIAILDVDYHHGNGTQDIFYDRSDVLFISLHADPNTQYPYFWGYADEQGTGTGEGYTLNLPLPRGCPEHAWFEALHAATQRIEAFSASALVISLGFDISQRDAIGDFGISYEGFARLGGHLAALDLPTVLVQEGGYTLDDIGAALVQVLRAFEGAD